MRKRRIEAQRKKDEEARAARENAEKARLAALEAKRKEADSLKAADLAKASTPKEGDEKLPKEGLPPAGEGAAEAKPKVVKKKVKRQDSRTLDVSLESPRPDQTEQVSLRNFIEIWKYSVGQKTAPPLSNLTI